MSTKCHLLFTHLLNQTEQNKYCCLVEVLELHRNQLTGTITENICQRLELQGSKKLTKLSVDCDLIDCNCCTCYINGTLVS